MKAGKLSKCHLIRRPWIWLLRLRNRKGYGVHSPSAYAFLRGVVYETGAYYAYATLNRLHPCWVRWFKLYPLTCRRLLFRLANFAHPRVMTIVGDRPVEEAYMRAAVPSAKVVTKLEKSDLLFIACEALPKLPLPLPPMPQYGMLILEGIHENAENFTIWHTIQDDTQTGNTYDLYTYGVVFFDTTKNTQHYRVNF